MVGPLKLHPLDLLVYMCTFAFLQMFLWIAFDGSLQVRVSCRAAVDALARLLEGLAGYCVGRGCRVRAEGGRGDADGSLPG